MNVNALKFPIVCFNDKTFYVEKDSTNLTRCFSGVLKGNWFKGMLIVDSLGSARHIRQAHKVRVVGFRWHSIITGPIVEIALQQEGEEAILSVDDVRELVYKASIRWHGIESRIDFENHADRIRRARNVAELIQVLAT